MIRLAPLAAILVAVATPAMAQDTPGYDFRERTRLLAFDPGRFFAGRFEPMIAIRYMGDDYDYPVYALALQAGCNPAEQPEQRLDCGRRLIARMVRSPYDGTPPRPRARGQRLFGTLTTARPDSDDALRRALDAAALEWVEADVRQCAPAMAHLATLRDVRFTLPIDLDKPLFEMVLHADKVRIDTGDYLTRSHYEGWAKPGTAGAWADAFAKSLEGCWKPASAPVPWRAAAK